MYTMREVKAYEMKLELAIPHLSLPLKREEREMGTGKFWKLGGQYAKQDADDSANNRSGE